MPFSVRLDPETLARLRKLAASAGVSKSVVLREAVAQYAVAAEQRQTEPPAALERLRPFIGTLDTGGAQYSDDTHAKYRAALGNDRRESRPDRRRRAHRTAR